MEGPRLMGASVKARPEKENASRDALEHDLQKWKPFSKKITALLKSWRSNDPAQKVTLQPRPVNDCANC
jgi:hypothetical protein